MTDYTRIVAMAPAAPGWRAIYAEGKSEPVAVWGLDSEGFVHGLANQDERTLCTQEDVIDFVGYAFEPEP